MHDTFRSQGFQLSFSIADACLEFAFLFLTALAQCPQQLHACRQGFRLALKASEPHVLAEKTARLADSLGVESRIFSPQLTTERDQLTTQLPEKQASKGLP